MFICIWLFVLLIRHTYLLLDHTGPIQWIYWYHADNWATVVQNHSRPSDMFSELLPTELKGNKWYLYYFCMNWVNAIWDVCGNVIPEFPQKKMQSKNCMWICVCVCVSVSIFVHLWMCYCIAINLWHSIDLMFLNCPCNCFEHNIEEPCKYKRGGMCSFYRIMTE